jgi:transposase
MESSKKTWQAATLKRSTKLEWIIFYYTICGKKKAPTARHFGITRKTLHKWLTRFDERHLISLEEQSRAPQKTRKRAITPEQRERIRKLRRRHIRWGKMKLQEQYHKQYGEKLSSWKFQVVIAEENLYYDKQTVMRNKAKRAISTKKANNRA